MLWPLCRILLIHLLSIRALALGSNNIRNQVLMQLTLNLTEFRTGLGRCCPAPVNELNNPLWSIIRHRLWLMVRGTLVEHPHPEHDLLHEQNSNTSFSSLGLGQNNIKCHQQCHRTNISPISSSPA